VVVQLETFISNMCSKAFVVGCSLVSLNPPPTSHTHLQILLQDPEPFMYHGEVVYRDGIAVGDVRAASYGHTLGGAVGLAFVNTAGDGRVQTSCDASSFSAHALCWRSACCGM
jgi:hypothetical protein